MKRLEVSLWYGDEAVYKLLGTPKHKEEEAPDHSREIEWSYFQVIGRKEEIVQIKNMDDAQKYLVGLGQSKFPGYEIRVNVEK
jgi:hypothetical protein